MTPNQIPVEKAPLGRSWLPLRGRVAEDVYDVPSNGLPRTQDGCKSIHNKSQQTDISVVVAVSNVYEARKEWPGMVRGTRWRLN